MSRFARETVLIAVLVVLGSLWFANLLAYGEAMGKRLRAAAECVQGPLDTQGKVGCRRDGR